MLTRHSRWRNSYHACMDVAPETEHGGDSDAELVTTNRYGPNGEDVTYRLRKSKHPFTGETVACAQSANVSTVSPHPYVNTDNYTRMEWVVCASVYRDSGRQHKEVSVGWKMTGQPHPPEGRGCRMWPWRGDDDQETLAGPIRILRKPSGHRGTVIGHIKWRGKGGVASSRTSVALRLQPGWQKQTTGLLLFPVAEMPNGWPEAPHDEGPVTLHGLTPEDLASTQGVCLQMPWGMAPGEVFFELRTDKLGEAVRWAKRQVGLV